jgi:hypothetical protein
LILHLSVVICEIWLLYFTYSVYLVLFLKLGVTEWYFLPYCILALDIIPALLLILKVFVLIFTPWFGMLLEPHLTFFLRHRKRSIRIFSLYTKKTIASQVESMLSCASILPYWIVFMPMLVLDLCNDCNGFVDPTISFRYRLKI